MHDICWKKLCVILTLFNGGRWFRFHCVTLSHSSLLSLSLSPSLSHCLTHTHTHTHTHSHTHTHTHTHTHSNAKCEFLKFHFFYSHETAAGAFQHSFEKKILWKIKQLQKSLEIISLPGINPEVSSLIKQSYDRQKFWLNINQVDQTKRREKSTIWETNLKSLL